jgi:hypothetical protein
VSFGLVVLCECVNAAWHGGFVYFGAPWRSWLRLFEPTVFAVAAVRIALFLLPSFARMLPRNS